MKILTGYGKKTQDLLDKIFVLLLAMILVDAIKES